MKVFLEISMKQVGNNRAEKKECMPTLNIGCMGRKGYDTF
jgi:hypothetical protein